MSEQKHTAVRQVSDAQALTAVLAWERCQEMADRSREEIVRDAWRRDAEAAWQTVERWLEGNKKSGHRAVTSANREDGR